MSIGEKQLNAWSNEFGKNYISRNQATANAVEQRKNAFAIILDHLARWSNMIAKAFLRCSTAFAVAWFREI